MLQIFNYCDVLGLTEDTELTGQIALGHGFLSKKYKMTYI